jgi:hypothetical protein
MGGKTLSVALTRLVIVGGVGECPDRLVEMTGLHDLGRRRM